MKDFSLDLRQKTGLALLIPVAVFVFGFENAAPPLGETEEFLSDYGDTHSLMTTESMVISVRIKFTAIKCVARAESSVIVLGANVPPNPPRVDEARRARFSAAKIVPQSLESVRVVPELGVVLQSKSGSQGDLLVGYYDPATAERVKKALDNWLKLCPDEPEPF